MTALSSPVNILSPYADSSQLGSIVVAEVFGVDGVDLPLSRSAAMQVPAVVRAQGLLTSSVARFPLRALDELGLVKDQPSWLYRTNGAVSPYDRLCFTVDDLIFFGNAVWLTTRGADGRILEAEYCPRDLWSAKDGQIYLSGRKEPLEDTECIVFDPIFPGLLNVGAKNLRGAQDVERAWHRQARNPIPLILLQVTDDSNLTQDEVDEYVKQWSSARNNENGAVGFLPQGIDMKVFGQSDPELMTTGRNATKADVSSYLGIPATMIDGSLTQASLTYTTTEGNRNLFYEFALPQWTGPIEARLSQDDVVPRGTRVRFDKYEQYTLDPAPTGAPMED